jgi:hypothetical protein
LVMRPRRSLACAKHSSQSGLLRSYPPGYKPLKRRWDRLRENVIAGNCRQLDFSQSDHQAAFD